MQSFFQEDAEAFVEIEDRRKPNLQREKLPVLHPAKTGAAPIRLSSGMESGKNMGKSNDFIASHPANSPIFVRLFAEKMEKTSLVSLYECFLQSTGVATDSRHCPAGCLFFALKGDRFNGNLFAAGALADGAAYAVIDQPEALPAGAETDPRYLRVDNALQALQQLAAHHRRQLGTPMLAITGTNGKTTTKELVSAVLEKKFHILHTEGNLNNHIGVPLTLLRLRREHELAVVEMGASHPGDIKELVEIADPDYGLITNVGRAHLEGFGSFEGVVRTKGELYDYLRRKGAPVFVNACNPHLTPLLDGLKPLYYAASEPLPALPEGRMLVKACEVKSDPFLSFVWQQAEEEGISHTCRTNLIGIYNIDNALAAAAVGCFFGVPGAAVTEAIGSYAPGNGRSQWKQTAHNRLIIDAYNANPTSMRASVENFAAMTAARKAVILGDMKELGAGSAEEHAAVVRYVDSCGFLKNIYVGSEFAAVLGEMPEVADRVECYETVEALVADFRAKGMPEDYTFLIKGSNSMRLSHLAEVL